MKQQPYQSVGYQPDPDNKYELTKKEKATPYYLSYLAAWQQRPFYEDPVEPVYVDTRPKPKRMFFVILIIILMAAIIGVLAVSYFAVLPEYFNLFSKVDAEDATISTSIGLDDIINGSLRKFFSLETEGESLFYDDCLKSIEDADTAHMIAFYALPVSIVVTSVIALYIFIKAIVAAATDKRHKFSYISLILLLFTLVGVVAGIVWNGQPIDDVLNFLTMSGTNLVLGIGYIIIVGAEILAWIASMCAYRSKKVAKY